MLGYYTVKLLGAESLRLPDRMRLETAYVAQLEALVGGKEALLALCAAARAEPSDGLAHEQLRAAGAQAEAATKDASPTWPQGARFSLSLWMVKDL